MFDDHASVQHGAREALLSTFALAAILGFLIGTFAVLRLGQMCWVAVRRPWVEVSAQFQEIRTLTPNGQPVLTLSDGEHSWTLTLAAVAWRWRRLGAKDRLLLAARPGRGGMVATPDRRTIAWAGRSPATTFLLWLTRGRRR